MFNAKIVFVFSAVFLMVAENIRAENHIVGAPSDLSGAELEEAKTTLKNSLAKLASGEGPNYKLTKLITASSQIVSGTLYRLHAELEDENKATKTCNVSIWSQPWLDNGIEVTFECNGEPKVVKKHSA